MVTADAWSSVVTKRYLCVTGHYIEKHWKLQTLRLAFEKFPKPHTSDGFASIMEEIFDRRNIQNKVYAVDTNNASDMVSGMAMMRDRLLASPREDSPHLINVRCLAYVVNLASKSA